MTTLDFNIGAQVHCGEEPCGKLLKVVLDPRGECVTDLIIQRGILFKKERVVPVSVVERTTDGDITLSIAKDELSDYAEYKEVRFKKPAPGWGQTKAYKAGNTTCWTSPYGTVCQEPVVPTVSQRVHENVESTLEVIERGTPVINALTEIGKVDHVLSDRDSGRITYLVVRRGVVPEYPIIPASAIQYVSEEGIMTELSEEALEDLPHYAPRPDEEVLAELKERLAALSADFGDVEATLEDGVVRLTGSVADVESKRRAEATVRSVDGVIDVENRVVVH